MARDFYNFINCDSGVGCKGEALYCQIVPCWGGRSTDGEWINCGWNCLLVNIKKISISQTS